MDAHFLLGAAGSGKTYRCLAEVQAELIRDAEGPPLLFLSPKQSTFQIERQLLSHEKLCGYTRLNITSFERLAAAILEEVPGSFRRRPLTETGRRMIIDALRRS